MRHFRYLALALTVTTGCGTIYWDIPPKTPLKTDGSVPDENTPPDHVCAQVRNGAIGYRTLDSWLGVGFGVLGGAAVATGAAMLPRSGHEDGYYETWGTIAGAGAFLVGAAIYFLTRAGDDRQEFWTMNAAVAQVRADYDSFPSYPSAHAAAEIDLESRLVLWTIEKARTQTQAQTDAALATTADNALAAAQAALKAATAGGQKLDRHDPLYAGLKAASESATAAHTTSAMSTAKASEATANVTLLANAMAQRQAGWADCSKAMTSVAGVDSTANTAFAAALGAAKGAASATAVSPPASAAPSVSAAPSASAAPTASVAPASPVPGQ